MKNKILFIAATHGNEDFSIEVLKKLEKNYPKEKYNYEWIIGNPKALQKKVRYIDVDLNRVAPGNLQSKLYEEKRAAEIIRTSNDFTIVIDIHGSNSNCGICTIISYPKASNISLAKLIGLKHNVIWLSKDSSIKGPLNQHVRSASLELECGPKNNPKIATDLYRVLEKFLIDINKSDTNITTKNDQEFYEVYDKEKKITQKVEDFKLAKVEKEEFFPFLTKNTSYINIKYYKMRYIDSPKLSNY